MEFYITPNASKYYPTPLSQTIWRVGKAIHESLRFIYNQHALVRLYNPEDQLNLPIFFITDTDLGESMDTADFVHVEKRYTAENSPIYPAAPLSLPGKVSVPKKESFGAVRSMFGNCLEKFQGLSNPDFLANPNCGIKVLDEAEVSPDWLGLYRGYGSGFRAIFIRIDKIMDEPLLNNSLGAAGIVLHELGHALMDANKNPKPYSLNLSQMVWPDIKNLLYYILEESLANMIAYIGICKSYDKSSPYAEDIVKFMGSKQPFPYTLGVKFGQVDSPDTVRVALPQLSQAEYVRRWYQAKKGAQIGDISGWVRLIISKANYTSEDLRQQCATLFGCQNRSVIESSVEEMVTFFEDATANENRIQMKPKEIDWEERHFQICLAMLSCPVCNRHGHTDAPMVKNVIHEANKMVELLQKNKGYETQE